MYILLLAICGGLAGSGLYWLSVYLKPEHKGSDWGEFFLWSLRARDDRRVALREVSASFAGVVLFLVIFG